MKFTAVILLIFSLSGSVDGDGPDTPVAIHLPLIWKILTLDRNARDDFGDEIHLGILYQKKYRTSCRIMQQMAELVSHRPPKLTAHPRVRVTPIELTEEMSLESVLQNLEIDAIYFTPLRSTEISVILRVSRRLRVRSFTGVSAYVGEGVAVGIGVRANKPRIIINLRNARSEGADYSAYLLKLARVVGE